MSRTAFFFLCTLLFAASATAAHSQTTLFNIPTSDTLQRGLWNVEGDFVTKPVKMRYGGYRTYGYRISYGLTHKWELGSNFYFTRASGGPLGQAEFSLKRKVYQSERRRITSSAGAVLFVPLRNRSGDRTSTMVYGNASKTISKLRGMTLTGGVYHVFRGSRDFGTRTGALIGILQPVTSRVSLVADWFSGNNKLGYISAGANFAVTKRQYLTTGYSFGNAGRGNNALAAYYGITF